MKIRIAGAAPDTATAIELIASSVFPNVSLHVVERGVSGTVPRQTVAALQCSLCVLDVLGLGWSQWYPEHEARVEVLLAGRAAILLLPPDSAGGWYEASKFTSRTGRVLLRRPVCAAGIKRAIRTMGAAAALLEEAANQRPVYQYLASEGVTVLHRAARRIA